MRAAPLAGSSSRVRWALEGRRSSGGVGGVESVEDFRRNGHDHEELVVFGEAQNLPVDGVGSGQGVGVDPGAEGRVARVAFSPPRPKFGVRQRQFANQVKESWFGWRGGADEGYGR